MSFGVHRIHDDALGNSHFVEFVGIDGRDLVVTVRFDADDHAFVKLLGAPGLHLTTETRETMHG